MNQYAKRIVVSAFLSILIGPLMAQSNFNQQIGTAFQERAHCAIQTFDGNYLLVGITDGFGSGGNPFLIKMDINGEIIWSKDYPGINEDKIKDIIELPDHSLVMCGHTRSYGEGYDDGFVMKTDSVGNVLWAKTYGTWGYEFGQKIVSDGVGGYYFLLMSSAYCVMHLDGLGNILWTQCADPMEPFSPLGIDVYKTDILPLASGGVVLAGNSNCRKFSSTGVYQWGYNYHSSPVTSPSGTEDVSLAENSIGEIILSTSLNNNLTEAPYAGDVFILKLSSMGNLIWSKSYGGTYEEKGMSILIMTMMIY
jgi:hypothetical protein